MHFYEFDIKLYHSKTEHLNETEDLAYRRLIDLYYLNELPLTNDINALARLIRMRTHSESIETVLKEFFLLLDDGWHHEHADSVLAKIYNKSTKASESAKRRWAKHYKDLGIKKPNTKKAMRTHSEGKAKAILLTNSQLTNSKNKAPKGVKAKILLTLDDLLKQVPDLTEQVAITFLDVRKRARAPISQLGLDLIITECKKANITTAKGIEIAAANSWRGFKAEYIKPDMIINTAKPWFLTLDGIDAKAKELGIEQGDDQYTTYRNKVLTLAGVKPDEYKEAKKKFN